MPLIDRDDSLLLVVDTQPGFFVDETPAQAAVERAVWLATVARLLEIPAIVTEEAPDREGGTDPRLLAALGPGAPVLIKPTFGLAETPELVAAVRDTGRTTAVLMGFETDVCVSQSAIGLRDLGFRVAVATDACHSQSVQQHELGLRRMAQTGIELLHCKGAAFEWMRTVERAISVSAALREIGLTPRVPGT